MPRKAKTQSTTKTAPGQPYGVAGEQVAAMEQVPIPDSRIATSANTTAPSGERMATPSTDVTTPANPTVTGGSLEQLGQGKSTEMAQLEAALSDAASMPAPSAPAFSTPPTTDELGRVQQGGGIAPPVRVESPVVQMLRNLSASNPGDDRLQQLAERAARLGY